MEKKRKHSRHIYGITLPASKCRRELNKVIRNLDSGVWPRVCITKNRRIVAVVHPYNGNNKVSNVGANTMDTVKVIEGKAEGLLKNVRPD